MKTSLLGIGIATGFNAYGPEVGKKQKLQADSTLNRLNMVNPEVVRLLLSKVDEAVLLLDYESALQNLCAALNLDIEESYDKIKPRLLELAFWYGESGDLKGLQYF